MKNIYTIPPRYRGTWKRTFISALFAITVSTLCFGKTVERENYRIQAGDTIEMSILQEPDMKSKLRVALDGSIHLPLVGKIDAAGHSVAELQSILYDRYDREFLVNPQIALLISDYAERRVRVRGKVNKPGFVLIPPEEQFTILDVIAAAGDITPGGNERKVELHSIDDEGNQRIRIVDLSQSNTASELSKLYLSNKDQVIVPEKLF